MVYKLSSTLKAHSSDVRSIASPSPTLVLSASRDTTAIVWTRPNDKSPFENTATYAASERFVNAIAYLRPTAEAPQGYAVTGSQDSIINVYAIGSSNHDPVYTLLGHSNNVCSLDTSADGTILSGSWDQTARVWKGFQSTYELKGHSASVLAVLILNDDEYLTASADKTIKSWNQHKAVRTFGGHTDAVRGLALIPMIGFASCSNDGDVKVWTTEGDLVHTLSGHTSFVYALTVLPTGDIVSSGEDRSVRVWQDGECVQTIVHPAISVWAVSSMPNGDIVSGASDKNIRIFSLAEDRWASAEELKAYEDTLANHAVPAQAEGSVDTSKLPGEDALITPGKKEGENKLVKTASGSVDVYTWTGGAWMKVGEMTDGTGSGEKKMYKGKEWDYVFDVDISDGAPKLQLPYNANENPYVAAQRFLGDNDLPPGYLDQIAHFIEAQTAGVNIGSTNNQYVDPYTGASRYQSSASSVPSATSSGVFQDPYTGASRYQSAAPGATATAPASFGGDPFTGASRYAPPSSSQPPPSNAGSTTTKILPVKVTLPFRQSNVPAMRTKLMQINEDLKNELTISAVAITKVEFQAFDRIFTYLQTVSAGSGVPRASLQWSDVDVVLQVLSRWPESTHFPLIDILRLVNTYCPEPAGAPPDAKVEMLDDLLKSAKWDEQATATTAKSRDTNVLLTLRALANCFHVGPDGVTYGNGPWTERLFTDLLKGSYKKLNKSQRVAAATLLFNFSCVALAQDVNENAREAYMELTLRILREEASDSETMYRALVAFGNTVSSGKVSTDVSLLGTVESAVAKFNEDRMKVLLAEIKALLS